MSYIKYCIFASSVLTRARHIAASDATRSMCPTAPAHACQSLPQTPGVRHRPLRP